MKAGEGTLAELDAALKAYEKATRSAVAAFEEATGRLVEDFSGTCQDRFSVWDRPRLCSLQLEGSKGASVKVFARNRLTNQESTYEK